MKQGRSRFLRLCIVVLALLALTCVGLVGFATQAQPVEGPVCYNHGDVNADGVIDSRDAVYTLYHYLFGEEEYPVLQDWDFNHDESLDSRDAIYVLCAYNFQDDPNYRLEGMVHNYYDPTWQWDGDSAVATFKCGCGQTLTLDQSEGVTVEDGVNKAASCVQAGSVEHVAQVVLNGQTYSSSKITTVPARTGGHDMVAGNCTTDSYCRNCDYTVAAPGHKWDPAADLSSEATCTENAVQGFRCSVCQETKTVTQENTAGHELEYAQDVAKGNCLYVKQYRCTVCTQVFDGEAAADSYYKHTYKATLTKEATCKAEGEKTYVCTECGVPGNTEVVPTNDSHNWDEGVPAGTVTTYTCDDCGETKTAVAVTEAVDKDTLGSAQELQLGNDISMKLDDSVVENLADNREIKISVDALTEQQKEQVSEDLSEEEKAQISGNTVYDLNMIYAGTSEKVQFEGNITVSLPYEYRDGEDIDSIDVWYIADDGTLEQVNGTYSKGFVTFTTDHFSYYTVTRLTAAQRCERYGHIPVESQKAASCTEDGYTMSECQRCMAVLSKEVHERTGHSYSTVNTAANCDTDGSIVKTCGNCGNTVTEIVPALGHTMELNEELSSAASCTAAGKEVYVCSRDNCSYTREDALAQLEHDYVADAPVIADCTNKGITTKTCKDCGDVVVLSETAPLGHSFVANSAVWSWAEDRSSATVTLYCEHDNAHTKVLNAVITETVVNSTCEGDGSVTYSAAASFNNVTYKDEKVITEDAPGHKPGAAWQSDKNQHYHICSVCDKKVDTAAHNWNDGTVIQAATCAEPGKLLVKCTVCAYQQEKVIAATGKHTYVNGVCSVCGHEESSCDHIVMKENKLDLSAYNVCAGTDIRTYGCECGQKARLGIYEMNCKFGEAEVTEQILPNGDTYNVETYTCTVCGLSLSGAFYELTTEAPCQYADIEEYSLSVGDTLILQTKLERYVEEHPTTVKLSETELTKDKHGLCGVKVITSACPCGEYVHVHEDYQATACDWKHLGFTEENGINTWRYECDRCGALKVNQDWTTPTDTTCEKLYTDVYTYYVGDEEVYSYTNTSIWDMHDNSLTNYELQGEDCEDGVLLVFTCADCGEVSKHFIGYHETVIETVIDVTDENTCFDAIIQMECPCGAEKGIRTEGEKSCQWGPLVEGKSSICSVCGTTVESTSTTTKDENCNTTYSTTHVYADKNGKELARVYTVRSEIDHDYERTYKLLGTSCEDGVEITEACTVCGVADSWVNYDHYTNRLESYDLSEYGMCPGTYEIYGCPCGEQMRHEINMSCGQDGGMGDRYWDESLCGACGVARRHYYEPIEQVDACHILQKNGYAFIKDGVVILDGTYERVGEDHDYRYTTSLMPGAVDCLGGVYVTATCKNCDYVSNWETHYHENFTRNRTVYGEGVLCSPIEVWEYSCACGQNSGMDVSYIGEESCMFGPEIWSDTYNAMVSTCTGCGTVRKNVEIRTPVEGQNCEYLVQDIYTYYADGEELFSYDRTWTSTRHNWIYELSLQGATCADGYYVSRYCQDCGEGSTDAELQYGCRWYDFSRELVCQDEKACGPVYLVMDGCACGNLRSFYLDCECSFDYVGYDQQLQIEAQQCRYCGLILGRESSRVHVENSCDVVQTEEYHFFRDGEKLAQYEGSYTDKSHTWVYSYTLNGETCEEGYSWTRTCRYCQTSETDSGYTGHETRLTAYYDLSDYGICDDGNSYIAHYSCACGQESYVNSQICCEWYNTGKDPDTGISQYYCKECGCTWYYNDKVLVDTETCTESGTFRAWWVKDGETLLSVEAPISGVSHTYLMTDVTFNVPDGNCESGYTITLACMYCGDTYTTENSYHAAYLTQVVDLNELGACGGTLKISQCPCGKHCERDFDHDCQMSNEHVSAGNSKNGKSTETQICSVCGLKVVTERVWSIPEGSCIGQNDYTVTLTLGDKTETVKYYGTHESHDYRRTNVVFDVPGGNCEGGYEAYKVCADCGYSYSYHSYNHSSEVVDRIDLTGMGACNGEIVLRGCACGRDMYLSQEWGCTMDYHEDSTGDNRNGTSTETRTCKDCGLKVVTESKWSVPEGGCVGTREYAVTVTMGDEVKSINYSNSYEIHEYFRTGVVFDVEGGDCESGYTAYMTCATCGETYEYHSNNHNTENIQRVELSELGACEGEIVLRGCACGEYSDRYYDLDCSVTSEYKNEGDEFAGYSLQIRTCAKCGLKIEDRRTWNRPQNTCQGTQTYEITVTKGDVVKTLEMSGVYESHDYEYTYEMKPGSVSCTDGLYAYAKCIYCGDGYTTSSNSHETTLKDSIDLTKYGSACGGTLDLYACLCGAEQHYELSEDCACDLDRKDTEMWIADHLDAGQETTHGWRPCWTYAYVYTCAVTDPACGMQIRMATYWTKKGCEATQYETWQLGYDAKTGECMYEFTVATGKKVAFHDYTSTDLYNDQGDGTVVTGTLYTCKDCNSTYMHRTLNKNGVQIKYEDRRVNTLDNGENKEYGYTYEYDYDLGLLYGYSFMTLSRNETIRADGSVYWYQDEYVYDFTDGCKATRTYTNSNGSTSVYEENGHRYSWEYTTTLESTCTQHGEYKEEYKCKICGFVESIYYHDSDPVAHDWHWDYEKDIYYCGTCGLESVNGASGAIILEDLTASYGNGTEYVIGYWDRENVNFGLYVSLIPEGADGDSEIVLEGIEFIYLTEENDGIRAISCDMEQVAQAAQASGQTGSYDIRINFIPMSGEHDLDYAITLTNVTAQ